jgi:hypothetical protein
MITIDPTLQYPWALPPTGIKLHNFAVGEAWRDFVMPLDNVAHELWISFMEETTAPGSGAFVSLDPSAGFPQLVVNKDGGGSVSLSAGGAPVFAGPSAGVGQVDFVVLHIAKFGGSSKVDLFLNPGATFGPPSATVTVPAPFFIARFYYRTDAEQELDEIRVGTLPADVAAAVLTGDLNCDGAVNFGDINPFVLYLSNFSVWQQTYINCPPAVGDINGDGTYPSFGDINPFVALLSSQ